MLCWFPPHFHTLSQVTIASVSTEIVLELSSHHSPLPAVLSSAPWPDSKLLTGLVSSSATGGPPLSNDECNARNQTWNQCFTFFYGVWNRQDVIRPSLSKQSPSTASVWWMILWTIPNSKWGHLVQMSDFCTLHSRHCQALLAGLARDT